MESRREPNPRHGARQGIPPAGCHRHDLRLRREGAGEVSRSAMDAFAWWRCHAGICRPRAKITERNQRSATCDYSAKSRVDGDRHRCEVRPAALGHHRTWRRRARVGGLCRSEARC